ncbi:MAG: hypothetical protein ACE5IR_00945 [bacterium]
MKTKALPLLFSLFVLAIACTNAESPREVSATAVASKNHLSLIPMESNFVLYANFESMRQTPFGREFSSVLEERADVDWDDDDYLDFLEATGFDAKEDIYEIWVSSTGKKERSDYDNFSGAIIRGRFDRKKINEYVRSERRYRMKKESYAGYTVYQLDRDHNEEFVYTFLNAETVVLGNGDWLRSVLDLSNNKGSNIFNNPILSDHIRNIPHKEHIWGVLNVDEFKDRWTKEIRSHSSGFKGSESLENMKTFIFYSYLDRKADVNLLGIFGRDQEAELFADMLNGFKAMAKLMVSDDREAIDMLNEIRVKSNGNTIKVSGSLDQDFLDKIEERSRNFSGREFKL